jgi:hypothetical protein
MISRRSPGGSAKAVSLGGAVAVAGPHGSPGVLHERHKRLAQTGNRGRGHQNLRYLLLKAKRLAVSNTEFIALTSVKKVA